MSVNTAEPTGPGSEPDQERPDRRQVLQALQGLTIALPFLSGEELLARAQQAHQGAASERWALFDGAQRRVLAAAVDTILPETDTPSASQCGVVGFVDRMVAEWFPDDARRAFVAAFDGWCAGVHSEHGAPFDQLPDDKRLQLLTTWHDQAVARRDGAGVATSPGRLISQHPFDLLKWLTIWGYFTSERGMREVRRWRAVPGRYRPDVPYP